MLSFKISKDIGLNFKIFNFFKIFCTWIQLHYTMSECLSWTFLHVPFKHMLHRYICVGVFEVHVTLNFFLKINLEHIQVKPSDETVFQYSLSLRV